MLLSSLLNNIVLVSLKMPGHSVDKEVLSSLPVTQLTRAQQTVQLHGNDQAISNADEVLDIDGKKDDFTKELLLSRRKTKKRQSRHNRLSR